MTVPRHTYGSRGIAAYRYHTLCRHLGPEHPATRAARGRLGFYIGEVPQRGLASIEAVAWHRESRAIPGWWNRRQRSARATHTVSGSPHPPSA